MVCAVEEIEKSAFLEGERENVTKMLKNSILLLSVSTLLSPIVAHFLVSRFTAWFRARGYAVYTGFAPWRVHPHRVRPHEIILNFLHVYFEFISQRQWIKELEINMFCFIVCTILSFFLSMRKVNLKHLIAGWVNVGANSPWGETGRHRLRHAHLCSNMSLIQGSTIMCPDLQQIIN